MSRREHFTKRQFDKMVRELSKLKKSHPNPEELDSYAALYKRWLAERDNKIDWSKIEEPRGLIYKYEELEEFKKNGLIDKLAVLKLNGGLGTTMGLSGPKSAIKVREHENFIDLTVKQLDHLNETYGSSVPLVLMNSFNTEARTRKMVSKYDNVKMFNQSQWLKISEENLLPISHKDKYYPPGHGDVFTSLHKSGVLDELIGEGKEYLFVSNIDNLAATVDLKILQKIATESIDFCIEVTKKTRADIKGGTLINYEDKLKLLEIAMVPKENKSDFTSVKKFKIFNTNNIWINLNALKQNIDNINLDIITNRKIVGDENVIQLETAIGSAIQCFENSAGILVPRCRFTPVKTCSDLFMCMSNLYSTENGTLVTNKKRINPNAPIVKLIGTNFDKIKRFNTSFKDIPDIVELDVLAVTGDVKFGSNVVLRGIVIICAPDGGRIDIPDGSILEDKVMFGNLPITDC